MMMSRYIGENLSAVAPFCTVCPANVLKLEREEKLTFPAPVQESSKRSKQIFYGNTMRAEQGNVDGDDLSLIFQGSTGVTLQTVQKQQQRLLLSSSSNDEDLIPSLIYYWKKSTSESRRRHRNPG